MTERVHLRLDLPQALVADPVLDSSPPEAKITKLGARHKTVLLVRHRGNQHIRLQNTMTVMGFCNRMRHAAEFPRPRRNSERRV